MNMEIETPSVVAFTDNERHVGESALNQAVLNPKRTITSIKLLMGRHLTDKEVQPNKAFLTYEIIDKGGDLFVQVEVKGEKQLFLSEEISAMILAKNEEDR